MISSCNIGLFEDQATATVAVETNNNNNNNDNLQEGDQCYEFQVEENLLRRVHLFYLDYSLQKVCGVNTFDVVTTLFKRSVPTRWAKSPKMQSPKMQSVGVYF